MPITIDAVVEYNNQEEHFKETSLELLKKCMSIRTMFPAIIRGK